MVVRQYPYVLWVLTTADAVKNTDGDWVPVDGVWSEVGRCRDEANSKGGTVNLEDGSAYTYDTLIQMPKGTPLVYANSSVEVRDGGVVRTAGTVKRSVADQLHTRIWV